MVNTKSVQLDQLKGVKSLFTLEGKKAIVTGAAGGIGRSTANAFAELGADVALMDINLPKAQEYADYIAKKHGIKTLALNVDVTSEASILEGVNRVVEEFGTIDIVHSNAGYSCAEDNADMPYESWEKELNCNLTGMFLMDRICANIMRMHGHGGSIINTASQSGHVVVRKNLPQRHFMCYSASKAGVIHLTKAMALEYAEDSIRFNSVSPGIMMSGAHDYMDPSFLQGIVDGIPVKRFGTMDDISGLVAFLATDLSSYMTGSDVLIDGGYTCW